MERIFSSQVFPLNGLVNQVTRPLVRSQSPLGNELVRDEEKAEVPVCLWSRRNISLKARAEVCATHICPTLRYRHSVLPLPSATHFILLRLLFSFLWEGKAAKLLRRSVNTIFQKAIWVCLALSHHKLHIAFLGRMRQ